MREEVSVRQPGKPFSPQDQAKMAPELAKGKGAGRWSGEETNRLHKLFAEGQNNQALNILS